MKKKIAMPGMSLGGKKINLDEEIKKNITVLEELKGFIPTPTQEERELLKESIAAEGCKEPLLLWEHRHEAGTEYILVDGHNRFGVCQEIGADFNIRIKSFENIEAVKDYMIDIQLGRRNLTEQQKSYLRGLYYNREKQKAFKQATDEAGKGERTSEKVAKQYNVSEKTIRRDAEFASGLEAIGSVDQAARKEILSGERKVRKADIQQLGKQKEADAQQQLAKELLTNGKLPVHENWSKADQSNVTVAHDTIISEQEELKQLYQKACKQTDLLYNKRDIQALKALEQILEETKALLGKG
ncbi:ParB N-terminal domain-containing protein [Limibacter armeniacum]|uniref:ParB N-terminal domain-containing protein n=1 Tax=Limibacter armeniacum TaxID=466084 RepID=UPI002FE63FE5